MIFYFIFIFTLDDTVNIRVLNKQSVESVLCGGCCLYCFKSSVSSSISVRQTAPRGPGSSLGDISTLYTPKGRTAPERLHRPVN